MTRFEIENKKLEISIMDEADLEKLEINIYNSFLCDNDKKELLDEIFKRNKQFRNKINSIAVSSKIDID
jgi:hypothetical protein